MAELAKESIERGDENHLPDQLELVLESLRRMDSLVTDLHERALVRTTLRTPEPIQLAEIVETAQVNLVRQINESNASITHGRLPVVHGTRSLLIQLFTNLLQNAIKYSPGSAPVIRIEAGEEEHWNVISISDNGRGVPSDQIREIFEPLARVDKDPAISGSGVGLPVCRAIMESHGGSIGAVSNPEGGMIFKLRFPRSAPEALL
jgi:signal transduction histidine kinase